jgi:predicted Zn-dependent peptidase
MTKALSKRLAVGCALATIAAVLLAPTAEAQDLAAFEKTTTVKVLDNGWTFIIVERPVAPVFSFATYANVGSAQELPGITGLAHMFEHVAFKGTPHLGTSDYEAEKAAIADMEVSYQAYLETRLAIGADAEEVDRLWQEFKAKEETANSYSASEAFSEILNREGATGLNAFTNTDFTGYFYSLPANKFELFAYLESGRFLSPVFREFYKERGVVQEERRLRTESNPIGRLIEQFVSSAFVAHPYKNPVVGHMSDLQSFTLTDGEEFFRTWYVPANLVTAIVGDVDAEAILPVIERYFGRIPEGPKPPALRTVEPPQIGEKTVVLEDPSQPIYIEGYHKPAQTHPDQPVWDVIDDVLSNGRTSRLYRSLVRDKKIAAQAGSFSSFPGSKYPTLWIAFAVPSPGIANEEVRDAIRAEIERLKDEDVSGDDLARAKTRAKAGLLRSLRNNFGLANNVAQWQTLFGDWRELFRYIDRIDAVTAEDVRRVVGDTLVASNRTVGMIVTESTETEQESGAAADDESAASR